MLLQFRNITRGWIATIIVGLVGLATVLFLIPNSGITFDANSWVAQVGDRKITPPQLTRELELTLQAARRDGGNVTQQEAIDAGEHRQILERMIARYAMYWFADRIGVSVSDAQVANYIRDIPATRNAITGNFDEAAYAAFLQQLRYQRDEFERDVRNDITTEMVMQSMVGGVRAPSSYGALLYTYTAEQRVISIAEAPASAVGAVPQPTEAQLQAFWEDNQQNLRLPEFRGLTLVYARPSDFVGRVQVPEARLREEFDARAAALTRPERRTYVRIAAANETQANEAASRLNRGESADSIATALNLQVTRGENQARSEVPDSAVAAAVFAAQVRGPAVVARGSLSPFVVVRVETSTPAATPNFADFRQQIHDAIADDEAAELLNTAISGYEDARAGGATLAEAARQHGLPVATIPAVTENGLDQQGRPIEALAGHEEILSAAFQTPEGEATDFIPAGESADVAAGVDRIIPATVRPLEEVRSELSQAWIARERARRLTELGEEIVTAVRGGQTLAAAARANGARVVIISRPIDRAGARNIPAQGLAAQIFAVRQGEAVSGLRADGGAMLVAAVERIARPDFAQQPQAVEAARVYAERPCVREALQQGAPPYCGLMSSSAEALQGEVIERSNPRRNEQLLERVYRTSDATDEDAQ
ncbi:MAG: SurA N-terminal domain-containing protein [Caulobacteraceae bacterium]